MTRWYQNPLAAIANLIPERIDQGVDYSGDGTITAPGAGTILETQNGGWPGGAFIALRYDKGPAAGDVMYFAEDITPLVQPGQHVAAGTPLGQMHGGIEIGWGDPSAIGASLAIDTGQWDSRDNSTGYGVSASNFLAGTGAPAGVLNPPVQGTVPAGYKFPSAGNGNLGNIDLNPVGWVSSGVAGAVGGLLGRLAKDVEHFAIIIPVIAAAAGLGVLGLYLMTKGPRRALEERTEQRAGQAAQIAAVAA